MNNSAKKLKTLTLSAVFCGLIFLATAYLPRIPFPGGYVHIGDVVLYISAVVLPTPYACAVGAIGAGLADALTGYIIWMPGTVIIKACMAVVFSPRHMKFTSARNMLATLYAGLICVGGYYIYEVLLTSSFTVPLASIVFNLVQASLSAVIYIILGLIIDRTNIAEKLFK